MKKTLSCLLTVSLLISQNPINAFPFSSITTKQIKNTVAITSGILAIPCYKKCFDLYDERDSLLRSVLPNFNELMSAFEKECDNLGYPTSTSYASLWDKFLKTNVEPTHPEVMPQLDALDYKATLFAVAGIALVTVALFCAVAVVEPKKTQTTSETNSQYSIHIF